MAKRKREPTEAVVSNGAPSKTKKEHGNSTADLGSSTSKKTKEALDGTAEKGTAAVNGPELNEKTQGDGSTTIQIITGSYERVLHGFTAWISPSAVTGSSNAQKSESASANGKKSGIAKQPQNKEESSIRFADTFLFNAHGSSIRCLALSPPSEDNSKITLATGSTDERINLYSLSACPPAPSKSGPSLPSLTSTLITENPRNRELGSLLHHSSSITALYFPTRSKLLSSAEDSTIAITRTRDWTPLSTIKAPIPKPQGRPSGDTAGPGEVPAGVNDFSVHPSMKLMVSVGKGERCMRLWNLVTGKKAGVLNFSRDMLNQVEEGRFGTGEAKKVLWDPEGEEFTVGFERGAVVFGIDSKPKARVWPSPRTKLHQLRYVRVAEGRALLAVSTEDGRIMFYDTNSTEASDEGTDKDAKEVPIPICTLVAQLGGPAAGLQGRVKDFEILPLPADQRTFIIVAGSSDGSVRIWGLQASELELQKETPKQEAEKASGYTGRQVGRLLGTYAIGTRITCLKAFVMTGKLEAATEDEVMEDGRGSSSSDTSDSE